MNRIIDIGLKSMFLISNHAILFRECCEFVGLKALDVESGLLVIKDFGRDKVVS